MKVRTAVSTAAGNQDFHLMHQGKSIQSFVVY
jgi:hypothetical protein